MFLFSEIPTNCTDKCSEGAMPKKSHEENLATVCCVCGRKGNKFSNVTDSIAEKVKLIQPSYDRHGGIHPTAICSSCRNACRVMEKDPEQTCYRVPEVLDYSTIIVTELQRLGQTRRIRSCSRTLSTNLFWSWSQKISSLAKWRPLSSISCLV